MTYPDIIPVLTETGKDYWSVNMSSGSIKGRVLIPQGSWNIRVNVYASQQSYVGMVARTHGAPDWDYSGIVGCSEQAWEAAPWMPDGEGTLASAATSDWQVKKQDGTAQVIVSNAAEYRATEVPCWLYLLPLVRTGSIYKTEIFFHVRKAGFQGIDWNRANNPVKAYPGGPRFIVDAGETPTPTPEPEPPVTPFPWPPWTPPGPSVPNVELMDNLDIVIQECVCRGETVKGPWTLTFEFPVDQDGRVDSNGCWRLK